MTLPDLIYNPYLVGPVCTLLGVTIQAFSSRRRTAALREQTAAKLERAFVDSSTGLLTEYRLALTEAREEAASVRAEMVRLLREIADLRVKVELQTTEIVDLNAHVEELSSALLHHGVALPELRRRGNQAT